MPSRRKEDCVTDIVQAPNTEEARARADRIRSGMRVLAEWQQDVIAAYAARDWDTLGYDTWDAYIDGEYGEHRVRLPREQRREIVAGMSAAGMSSRAIGAAVGVDHKTVVNDRAATGENSPVPETVLSLDGRERPATRPAPEPNIWVEPGVDEVVDAEIVDEPAQPEPPKPKRPPLDKTFMSARVDLERAANRLGSITSDDRFPRNRQMVHGQMTELMIAVEQVAGLVEAADLPSQEDERLRHWWAERLNTIGNALTGIANNLN
jgi:hypothetical protein